MWERAWTEMKKVFLNEFSGKEIQQGIEQGRIDCAITVFGACESHGPHLPLGPDLFVPAEIARRAAMQLDNVVVAPEVPFGTSLHYNKFPISVTLKYETCIAIAEDVIESLIEGGIEHVVILNGHDGNIPALEIAARNVKDRYEHATIVYIPAWWEITRARMPESFDVWDGLGHGGEGETSITMAVKPDLVDLDEAVSQVPHDIIELQDFMTVIWDIGELSETGAIGDPTRASREKGEKMLDIVVDYLVSLIRKLDERDWKYERI